ncbi:hypothetical protein HGM15179_018112, partial [Zosterops borbonicus]
AFPQVKTLGKKCCLCCPGRNGVWRWSQLLRACPNPGALAVPKARLDGIGAAWGTERVPCHGW